MSTTTRPRYPSDLTDFQWANIEHLFPHGDGRLGRPRSHAQRAIGNAGLYPATGGRHRRRRPRARREIVNAVLYLAKGGCSWRMLPHDFPPWKTVSYYFYTWRDAGVWERVHAALRPERPGGAGAGCPRRPP